MAQQLDPFIRNSRKALTAAISAICAGVPLAHAQGSDELEGDAKLALEEITVTATKRGAMNLQDVPISMTVFTSENIQAQGFKQLDDYFGQIPSLTFGRLEPGGTNVIMRGCAISGFAFGDNPTTGVYLDEQPITNAGFNPDPRLIDIERVEALAGPQGTTFGDASMCGTLRIITNKPVMGESSSWIDVTGSAATDGGLGYDFSTMLNVPLAENVAMRLVGFSAHDPGYVDNIFGLSPGGTFDNADVVDKDVNGLDVYGARAAVRWQPTDTWNIDFQGMFQSTSQNGIGDTDTNALFYEDRDFGDWQQLRFSDETFKDDWYQLALTVEKDLGWGIWTATGSYFHRNSDTRLDVTTYLQGFQQLHDYIAAQYPEYTINVYDWGGDPKAASRSGGVDKRTTFETRFATSEELSSRWSLLAGFFYNKYKSPPSSYVSNVKGQGENCTELYAAAPGCTGAFTYLSYLHYAYFGTFSKPSDNWWTGIYENSLTSTAAFGEFTYNVTENFHITVGGRWYKFDTDRRLTQGTLMDPSGTDLNPNCASQEVIDAWQIDGISQEGYALCFAQFSGKSSESGFVPKFNATWDITDDTMVYATYSEGFRHGGANGGRRGSVFATGGLYDSYTSDQLINYEVGTKNSLLDGRMTADVTFYRMDWKDIQIQAEDPDPLLFGTGIINFPKARINGIEGNFSFLPVESLTLTATLGYNDAKMAEEARLWPDTDDEVVIPKDTRLPLMPKWKFSFSPRWDFDGTIWNAQPWVMATWTYNGDSLNSLGVQSTIGQAGIATSPAYNVVDLRFGLEGENWSAQIFADNLFNEYAQMFYSTRQTQPRLTVLPPRIIGIQYRKDFDW